MRWYRKAQLAWFGVFAVASLILAWAILPVASLTTSDGTTFVFDRVVYTAIGLILAGLFAAAAGGETDYQDALRRYGFASDESFDANKAMIYWMRVGAIFFLLMPFALLAVEAEGHAKPISFLRNTLAHLSSDASEVFSLLYNSIYGLCITLLAIDFFMTPLSAQIIRSETTFASKDKFGARATDVCSRFLGAMKMVTEQNVPDLRGTPNVWTTLAAFVAEIGSAKQGVALLSLDLKEAEAITAHLTDLQGAMEELMEFPMFLSRFDAKNASAGRRQFRNAASKNMAEELTELANCLNNVYADLNLPLPQNSKQLLDRLANEITTTWQRVHAAGETHYQMRPTQTQTPRPSLVAPAAAASFAVAAK
jgi:hypothetical protein